MKQVPIEVYGMYISCMAGSCTLNKLCTNHCTAGDYRNDWGVRPELYGMNITDREKMVGTIFCKTCNITYEVKYDQVANPELITYGECVLIDEISPQLPLDLGA